MLKILNDLMNNTLNSKLYDIHNFMNSSVFINDEDLYIENNLF